MNELMEVSGARVTLADKSVGMLSSLGLQQSIFPTPTLHPISIALRSKVSSRL